MDNTITTYLTQVLTTLLTVGATILVAFLTYRSQKAKTDADIKRLQSVNCKSSLELFKAYIAALVLFTSPKERKIERKTLLVCIEKMKLIEQYLAELTESDLPDTFIEDFRVFRLKLSFQRISIENCMTGVQDELVSSSIFNDLEILSLISSVEKFVSSYDL